MESIIQSSKECFVCGTKSNLHCHHIFFGTYRRKVSEDNGLKIYLCINHHTGLDGVHTNRGHELDISLKRYAQIKWQEVNNKTSEDFIKLMGRSYL